VFFLLATLHKNTEQIFMKILPEMYLWIRKNGLDFGRHLPLNLDLGIFWRILRSCKIGSYLWKNWSDLHENFARDVSLDMESPIKFWKSSGTAILGRGLHSWMLWFRHVLLTFLPHFVCLLVFFLLKGCDLEKDLVTCEVNYGGLLLLNNLIPHQR